MGLDTTHDCFHGPYSTFNEWRNVIAEVAGYEIVEDVHFYNGSIFRIPVPKVSQKTLEMGAYGRWKRTPIDPLVVLLAHSDCEGVIQYEQTEPLASRLEELIDFLPKDRQDYGLRYTTRRFIDGLRLAASRGEDVEFL